MGSDRARNTYDETKQYRRVVPQQGRVILEADLNEASAIATEDVRHEVLDIVGPVGVPSDPLTDADGTGYAITSPVAATHELSIGAGVIYVGGWRVVQPDPELRYSNQPDWIDRPTSSVPVNQSFELVALRLREQEVSAAEDATLREVALGGPDTAQRVRLIRRVERFTVNTAACSAFADVVAAWTKLGLVFDPNDMSLAPTARLAVGKETLGPAPKPCDPAANDGYLGAENQMIRVQIASATQLLWGYDDGSALYRVDVADKTKNTLVLRQVPVDAFHQPRKDQYVEVLRAAADLGGDAYAAATTGFVTTLASAYLPDVAKVVLTNDLPSEYLDPAQTRAIFLRVWENRATFTAGTPQPLVDQAGNHTGLQVTLTSGPFIAGSFWCFAVRPTTPADIYPARYTTPQPPEGPREWACPLGVIDWKAKPPAVSDCRPTFDNLVTLTSEVDKLTELERNTGCCTVTVRPEDLTEKQTLQTIVDKYKAVLRIGSRVTICLEPGVYQLREPLRLGADHSGLAIEGCHGGAVLQAAQGAEQAFLDGLIVLVHANEVTLRGLRFHLPQVAFAKAGGRIGNLPYDRLGNEGTELQQLSVSIAVRPVHAAELTVEGCVFRYSLAKGRNVFGVGIFAGSECWGLHLVDNQFVMEEDYLRDEANLTRLLVGYILVPSVTVTLGQGSPTAPLSDSVTGGTVVRPLLTGAELRGNVFSGLVASALIIADTGTIRIEDNRVRDSYAGFWIISLQGVIGGDVNDPGSQGVDVFAFEQDPMFQTTTFLALGYPTPPGLQPDEIVSVKVGQKARFVGTRLGVKHAVPEVPGKQTEAAKQAEAVAKHAEEAAKRAEDAAKQVEAAANQAEAAAKQAEAALATKVATASKSAEVKLGVAEEQAKKASIQADEAGQRADAADKQVKAAANQAERDKAAKQAEAARGEAVKARTQAEAAREQAARVREQVDLVRKQAEAAGKAEVDAARKQAESAREQAEAARKAADLARKQADAARKQADAAANQPDAAVPGAAGKAPDAVSVNLANEELALAMRFAAEVQRKVLDLRNTVAPALGIVLVTFLEGDTRRAQSLALRVADNEIDLRLEGMVSGSALAVVDFERDPQGSVIVSANRMANVSLALATVVIGFARRIAITGNLMMNDTLAMRSDAQLRLLLAQLGALGRQVVTDKELNHVSDIVLERWCLIAVPSPGVADRPRLAAITGNVLEGLNELPVRPPVLPPWDTLNTLA